MAFNFTMPGDTISPPASSTPPGMPSPAAGSNPLASGLGGAFSWMKNKNKPQQLAAPAAGMQYTKLEQPARQDLLNAMLQRARGGQAGGAPTTPLPAPNSQAPIA